MTSSEGKVHYHPSQAFNHFANRTGMHAVNAIAFEKRRSSKFVWSLLLVISVSVMAYQTYDLTIKLTSRPTLTKTSIEYSSPMTFPAVTICNLNPIKKKQLMRQRVTEGFYRRRKLEVETEKAKFGKMHGERQSHKERPFVDSERQSENKDVNSTDSLDLSSEIEFPSDETTTRQFKEREKRVKRPTDTSDDLSSLLKLQSLISEEDEEDVEDIYITLPPPDHVPSGRLTQRPYRKPVNVRPISNVNTSVTISKKGKRKKNKKKKPKPTEYQLREDALYLINTLSGKEYQRLIYGINDMLLQCSFRGIPCDGDAFSPYRDPRYGACYTFNSGMNARGEQISLRQVNSSGSTQGLEMTLFVDQKSYLPKIAPNAGFKIVIHDAVQPPLPEEDGYLVGPGRFTTFGVRKTIFIRAEEPYGHCKRFTKEDNATTNMFLFQLNRTQPNLRVCMRTCEQLEILRHCHCYSLQHGFADAEAFNNVNDSARKRPCRLSPSSKDLHCIQRITQQVSSGELSCKHRMCKFQECVSNRFDICQSSAVWPADHSKKSILSNFKRFNRTKLASDSFEKDFVKVLLYFEDLTVVTYETKAAYTYIDFVSDLGGQGGLWLGISVFTMIEVMVLLFELSKIVFCNFGHKFDYPEKNASQDERKIEKNLLTKNKMAEP